MKFKGHPGFMLDQDALQDHRRARPVLIQSEPIRLYVAVLLPGPTLMSDLSSTCAT
jgi:hypothetical protein